MIKATTSRPGRPNMFVIGLSFGNLDKFRAEPGDTYIMIKGSEHGLPCDIMIMSGETEAHMAGMFNIGADTKVIIDPSL